MLIVLLIFQLIQTGGTEVLDENSNDFSQHMRCRTGQKKDIPYDMFRRDTCARCYLYMPFAAFIHPNRKFKHGRKSVGMLRDPDGGNEYEADPDNITHAVFESFSSEDFVKKWASCCRAARRCCDYMLQEEKTLGEGLPYCPRTWDGWQCWPDTPGGTTAKAPCPDHIYFKSDPPACMHFAEKVCLPNGTWYVNLLNNEWTNYTSCGKLDDHRHFLYFHIVTYGVSITFLIPALIIFSIYNVTMLAVCTKEEERAVIRFLCSEGVPGAEIHRRLTTQYGDSALPRRVSFGQLQVHRITMHKNLFMSLLLNAVMVIVFKSVVILDELNSSDMNVSIMEQNGDGCRFLFILTKYCRMTNYMWMFCEGFYLHKLIAAAFAEQKNLIMFYVIGWIFPVIPVSIYAILRKTFADEKCWAFPAENFEWIMNLPNLLSLLMNLAFLCNIIRVLVTKLRATHANEPSQYRKAVRATLVLVPLFGLHFCLIIYRPHRGTCGIVEAYTYFNHAMDGLQGFLVSLIFCFLNSEVLYLLRRSYQRYHIHNDIGRSRQMSISMNRMSSTQVTSIIDSHAGNNIFHPRSATTKTYIKEHNCAGDSKDRDNSMSDL